MDRTLLHPAAPEPPAPGPDRGFVRRAAAGLALAAALALAACGQSSPIELPDLAQKPPPGLSSEEQKRAIGAMSERKSTHATEAVKEIEGARPPR